MWFYWCSGWAVRSLPRLASAVCNVNDDILIDDDDNNEPSFKTAVAAVDKAPETQLRYHRVQALCPSVNAADDTHSNM